MDRNSSILVTGGSGMVGSAVVRLLRSRGYPAILAPLRAELDLLDGPGVENYFRAHRPEYVFMIAARVGGIAANSSDPAGFLSDNARMTLNLFQACQRFPPRKNLFLGSSCIYPRMCPQPIKEEYLLTGPFEPTNEGYAIAKLMGLRYAAFLHRQYGMPTVCPVPCNLYGTNDHFDFERSHVLSALVRRFVDAVDEGMDKVTLWGSGEPRREFLHVDDAAEAILLLMEKAPDPVNVGSGGDISIRDLASLVARLVGYRGEILCDREKPDGMPVKCLDVSRLSYYGFRPRITLEQGVGKTIGEYKERKNGTWKKA
jgi:GDP-L-fucose synthase